MAETRLGRLPVEFILYVRRALRAWPAGCAATTGSA